MKFNKAIAYLLLGAAVLALPAACTRDEKPVFDKKPTVRMNEALENAQKVLMAAEHGWRMDYFLDESNTTSLYGGYTLLVKFEEDQVTAWGEMVSDPSESYTSLYTMTTDYGPVLSFDDNNYILHYYCTPSGTGRNLYGQTSHYQAMGGDFEFLILEAKPECVKLKGKRGGVKINLYPLDKEPAEYLRNVVKTRDDIFVTSFLDAADNLAVSLDLDNRHITFLSVGAEGEQTAVLDLPFLFTENGIRTIKSLKEAIGENPEGDYAALLNFLVQHDDQNFAWSSQDRTLAFGGITMAGNLPSGWLDYNDFLGEYTALYNSGANTINVKLEQKEYRKSYTLSGFNSNYTLEVLYDLSQGCIILLGQTIGGAGDYTYWFAPWSLVGGGSLWYSTTYGMKTELDKASYAADPAHFVLNWVSAANAAGKPIDSFILYARSNSGGTNSGLSDTSWHFPGTNFRLAYLSKFTKK